MKVYQLKVIIMILMFGFVFQSCSKDESEISEEIFSQGESTPDLPLNGPNGPGQEGPLGPMSVANIENDILKEWTNLMLDLDRYASGMRPTASARAFAYIFLASYETALPGMRGYTSNANRLQGLNIDSRERPRNIHFELALNACFNKVMDHFIYNLPSEHHSKIADLESRLENSLAQDLPSRLVSDSKEWGSYIANTIIEYSKTDQTAEAQIQNPQPSSYIPPTGDGVWSFSAEPERALFPYWGKVRTFVVAPEETSTIPPIAYSEDSNSAYFLEMMECYVSNNEAKNVDGEQLWIAEFWSDDVESLTFGPPAREYSISNQLIEQFDLNLEESLTLYMKLGFSLNDAAVATWKYKYDYMVMRPNVYIKNFIDETFQTNLFRLVYWPNPSFPGYPSGHSTFASAAAGIFINYFGNDVEFTDRSHEGRTEFQSAARTYLSLTDMAEENAFSRIPLGVHMRMDCTEGLRLGYEISDEINELNWKTDGSLIADLGVAEN